VRRREVVTSPHRSGLQILCLLSNLATDFCCAAPHIPKGNRVSQPPRRYQFSLRHLLSDRNRVCYGLCRVETAITPPSAQSAPPAHGLSEINNARGSLPALYFFYPTNVSECKEQAVRTARSNDAMGCSLACAIRSFPIEGSRKSGLYHRCYRSTLLQLR
jgi:hypothetical protein